MVCYMIYGINVISNFNNENNVTRKQIEEADRINELMRS